MKKLISSLLVLVLCLSGLSATAAAPLFTGEVKKISFQEAGDRQGLSLLNENPTLKKEVYPQLKTLLQEASSARGVKDPTTLGSFTATGGQKPYTYDIYYTGDHDVYLRPANSPQSKDGRTFYKVDGKEWNDFTFSLSQDLYTHSYLPIITLGEKDNTVPLGLVESDYRYLKLDGRFYRIRPSENSAKVPTVTLEQLKTPKFTTPYTPNSVSVAAFYNGKQVWSGKALEDLAKFSPKDGGEYLIQVTARYDSPYAQGTTKSQAKLQHNVKDTRPYFSVVGSDTFPGEMLILQGHNIPTGQKITATTNVDFTPTFFSDGAGGQMAFFPVSYRHNAGNYTIALSAGTIKDNFEVWVKDKTFQIQHLTASKETTEQTLLNKTANEEFEKHIGPIRHTMSATPYWKQADFLWPVGKARITTQFGMKRYVNGAPTSYRHGAIDFAVPLGTPVKSTGNGEVLYAGYLQLTGYTVVIEHGFGLKSWYYHMNSLDVSTGDIVKAGQIIGTVGSTGFSTGPHLHFGFSINNVFINPDTIIEDKILTLDETAQ